MIGGEYLDVARRAMRDRVIAEAETSVQWVEVDIAQTAYGQGLGAPSTVLATVPCRIGPLPSDEQPGDAATNGVEYRLLTVSSDVTQPVLSNVARIGGVDWQIVAIRRGPAASCSYVTISRGAA